MRFGTVQSRYQRQVPGEGQQRGKDIGPPWGNLEDLEKRREQGSG